MSYTWAWLRTCSEGRKVHRYKYLSDLHYLSPQARHGYVVRWSLIPTYHFLVSSLFPLESEEGGHTPTIPSNIFRSSHGCNSYSGVPVRGQRRNVRTNPDGYVYQSSSPLVRSMRTSWGTGRKVCTDSQCVHSFVTSIGSKG